MSCTSTYFHNKLIWKSWCAKCFFVLPNVADARFWQISRSLLHFLKYIQHCLDTGMNEVLWIPKVPEGRQGDLGQPAHYFCFTSQDHKSLLYCRIGFRRWQSWLGNHTWEAYPTGSLYPLCKRPLKWIDKSYKQILVLVSAFSKFPCSESLSTVLLVFKMLDH